MDEKPALIRAAVDALVDSSGIPPEDVVGGAIYRRLTTRAVEFCWKEGINLQTLIEEARRMLRIK